MPDTVDLDLDELLRQVQQCIIAGAGKEQWLTLHILTPSARELGAFRVSLLPNGRLQSVPTLSPPQQVGIRSSQHPTEEEQQSTQTPSQFDPITVATASASPLETLPRLHGTSI
jgi:hypothetical protein